VLLKHYRLGRGRRRRLLLGVGRGRDLLVRLGLGAERCFLFGPASLAAAIRNFASRRPITKVFLLPGVAGFVMRSMVDEFASQVKIQDASKGKRWGQ